MTKFKPGPALPVFTWALMAFFASATISEAQAALIPPPIPEDEVVEEAAVPPALPEVIEAPAEEEEEAAAPPPLPPVVTYFVDENGTPGGPYTVAELTDKINRNEISAQTLAWTDGMAAWTAAGDVEALSGLFDASIEPTPTQDAFDYASYLRGIWIDQNRGFVQGMGQVETDALLEYYPDGTNDVIGLLYLNENGQPVAYEVYGEGSFSVVPAGGNLFDITTRMTIYLTYLNSGLAPNTLQTVETTRYERIDNNRFRDVTTGFVYTRY